MPTLARLQRLCMFLCLMLLSSACANSATGALGAKGATATRSTYRASTTPSPTVSSASNPACAKVLAVTKGWEGNITVKYAFEGQSADQHISANTMAIGQARFDQTSALDQFTGFRSSADLVVIDGDFQTGSFVTMAESGVSPTTGTTSYTSYGFGSSGNYGTLTLDLPESGEFISLDWQPSTCMFAFYFHGADTPVKVTTSTETHTILYPFFAMDTGFIPSNGDPHLKGQMTIPVNTSVDSPPYFQHTLITTQGNIGSVQLSWDLRPLP